MPSQADAVKLFAAPKIEKKMAFDSVLLPWDKIIPNVKYAPSICEADPAQLNPNPIPIPNPDPDPNPNPTLALALTLTLTLTLTLSLSYVVHHILQDLLPASDVQCTPCLGIGSVGTPSSSHPKPKTQPNDCHADLGS